MTDIETKGAYCCAWCSTWFDRPHRKGPAPKYCRRSCRQRAYEYNKLAALLGVDPKTFEVITDETH